MKRKYNSLMASIPHEGPTVQMRSGKSVMFPQPDDSIRLNVARLCKDLCAYKKPVELHRASVRGNGEPADSRQPGDRAFVKFTDKGTTTDAQWKIIDHIVNSTHEKKGTAKATYTFLNAGAGVGKSYIGRKCNEAFEARGQCVINMCPTGAGACQMTDGRTIHSLIKPTKGKQVSQATIIAMRDDLPTNLGLVIIDEASMLAADHLVILDARLRQLYDRDKVFGGISVLLLGDLVSD
jgi:hypothetical protein